MLGIHEGTEMVFAPDSPHDKRTETDLKTANREFTRVHNFSTHGVMRSISFYALWGKFFSCVRIESRRQHIVNSVIPDEVRLAYIIYV